MTVLNRAITAQSITKKHSLANVTRTQVSAYTGLILSKDRTYFFAVQNSFGSNGAVNNLYRSIDDIFTSFSLIHTFTTAIRGFIELANGEAAILLDAPSGASSQISFSTGWSTNQTTATWGTPTVFQGDKIPQDWGFNYRNVGKNGVMVVNTYGAKTATGLATTATNLGAGCRVFLTQDYGVSGFTEIFNLLTSNGNLIPAPNNNGNHVHCSTYDEEWDRIWVAYGDDIGSGYQVSGTSKLQLIYSDDRGTTWNTMAIPPNYPGAAGGLQFTTIVCTHDNVILLPDSSPFSVCTFPKTGYRQLGTFRAGPMLTVGDGQGGTGGSSSSIVGHSVFQAPGNDMPIFAGFNQNGTGGGLTPASLMCSSNNGNDWYEILRFPTTAVESAAGFMQISMQGPTASGKVYGASSYKGPSGTWSSSLITADLVLPA